jgi:hypothetical protein
MTAAEILRSAQPPVDDVLIEKAITDLDAKIWEWTDALKSAHAQLRSAFAVRAPAHPSASLSGDVAVGLPAAAAAAAAAAHVPAPPPMPAEWTAPPPVPEQQWAPSHGGHGLAAASSNAPGAGSSIWSQAPASGQQAFQPADASAASPGQGVMSWPTAPGGNWPDANSPTSSSGTQAWPTWTPTEPYAGPAQTQAKGGTAGSSARPAKAPKAARPVVQGPTPEERARKAAAEEALLSELEEAIARRVRLLRRLDPDTAIEKLIDKAKQGHAEAAATATTGKDDKSSSSWWRRK